MVGGKFIGNTFQLRLANASSLYNERIEIFSERLTRFAGNARAVGFQLIIFEAKAAYFDRKIAFG